MASITISRQLGSLGTQVAHAVGHRLGFRVVCRDVINQAALQAGAPEMALAFIDELGLLEVETTPAEEEAFRNAMCAVMEALADAGSVVIVGRAGQVILQGRPDVFHVRIIAPLPVRAARLARAQNITLEQATAQAEASDASRRAYLRRHYGADWDDPDAYDLILNTARLSPPLAAEIISTALRLAREAGVITDPPTSHHAEAPQP